MNRNIVRNPKRRKAWAAKQGLRCWACGKTASYGHHFEVAHILGGACRTDEECNLCWLGHSCHAANHGRKVIVNGKQPAFVRLSLANMLFLKAVNDPDNYDLHRLRVIKGEFLPDPEAPEQWYGNGVLVNRVEVVK